MDEAVTGAHVQNMLENGTDANGKAWPIFSESIGGGYTTSVYLYPLTAWSVVFGTSEYALRSFSVFVTVLSILILGLSMRLWFGKNSMYLTWLVGLTLPWAWLSSSLAWDPVILPLFVSLAVLSFSLLLKKDKHRLIWLLILGTSLLLGAYAYPPFRVSGPLLLLGAVAFALFKKRISWIHVGVLILWCSLLALPLAAFLLEPSALGRSQAISVFADGNIINGVNQILLNYFLIINPGPLFITGDPNLRHSTGILGMLGGVGLIGTIGLIGLFKKKKIAPFKLLFVTSVVGVALSVLGSALTNEGQPHFLRATAAWPFFVILIVIGWHGILAAKRKYIHLAASATILLTSIYVIDLAVFYPERSAEAFDVPARQLIESGEAIDYPQKSLDYYKN